MSDGFSDQQREQLEEMLDRAVTKAFDRVGLRIEDSDNQFEANADFRWVRASRTDAERVENERFVSAVRRSFNGAASKVGIFVLLAIAGGVVWIVKLGFDTWNKLQ